jgi:hypothetical protein
VVRFLPNAKELFPKRDFKIAINNVTRDLCDKGPSDILNYKTSLDAVLNYPELWSQTEWKDLAGLIKRMLHLPNSDEVRRYGRELIRKLTKLPNEYKEDLIHQLTILSQSSPSEEEKQDCKEILKKF